MFEKIFGRSEEEKKFISVAEGLHDAEATLKILQHFRQMTSQRLTKLESERKNILTVLNSAKDISFWQVYALYKYQRALKFKKFLDLKIKKFNKIHDDFLDIEKRFVEEGEELMLDDFIEEICRIVGKAQRIKREYSLKDQPGAEHYAQALK